MSAGEDDNVYSRPVSPTETWFLVYPESVPGVIQIVIEGAGHIGHDELVRAVEAASEACPGARLTRQGMTWVDSGVAPVVRVLPGDRVDRHTFAGAAELHSPLMGKDGGPTCELLLLTDPECDTLIVRAFHGVMDGQGVRTWAEDIFRVLRGEDPVGAPSRITENELIERAGAPQERDVTPDLDWPSALGARPQGRHDFFWRRRTVDGAHPALVAKIACAVTQACGLRTGRFLVPVDLRRYLPGIRSTGNLTNNPLYEVRGDAGWEQAQEKLLSILSTGQDLAARVDPSLPGQNLTELHQQIMGLDAYSAQKGCYSSLATLSHMGRVAPAAFSTSSFHATTVYSLPNSGPLGPPEINAVEFGDRTEITIGWYDGAQTPERAEALLDRIEEALSPRAHREWDRNRTERALDRQGTAVDQFRRQVSLTPGAIALTGPEGEVTFRELDRRADAVAVALLDRGIGRDDVVGLLAGRTVAAMAAIWGVLKAGAAYLPLDPQQPDDRLAGLVADAGATVCLAEHVHAERRFTPDSGCDVVVLETLEPSERRPEGVEVRPEDLAYVIYTSGSTGRPKGVEIEHRQLATFISWATRVYGVDSTTRFPLFTSLAFDLSNTAIFLPVLAGGSIALVPDEPNHVVLRDMLESSGANALKLTPTHLDLIGRLGLRPAGFRAVIAGGELLRGAVADRAQQLFGPQCGIFNEYGPTETTIGCMTRRFDPDHDADLPSVPIGVPTDNTRIHLIGGDGRHVAPGEVGEMYLAGDQLARGYRGRPDLVRERFTALADGTRVYRSGDLARMLESGELESVGRNDEQVKVLGYRVEPAEVAKALEEHPAVATAFVTGLVRPGTTGKVLCAFVVLRAEATVDELTDHVAGRLPRYMVPATTTVVAELPRTVNEKVDVAALPLPFTGPQADAAAAEAKARGEVEEAVAKIWARVLAVDVNRLAAGADFHRLGGDSATLLAMLAAVSDEVVGSRREREFMAALPAILRQPTLAKVSEIAEHTRDGQGATDG
ncbi:non-ribosomal peptide synthetase [Streptomyces mutomycini]|uniref:Non-ribosomal peptide synthetase n=1 Tax=Streptomyces mutomycini TaxID=284036 RepID=A0ABW0BCL8_9ACTN|nr:non-ribosomal peptide synthetase [Streptomyces mutomycini]